MLDDFDEQLAWWDARLAALRAANDELRAVVPVAPVDLPTEPRNRAVGDILALVLTGLRDKG